jgi:hypothetical protein
LRKGKTFSFSVKTTNRRLERRSFDIEGEGLYLDVDVAFTELLEGFLEVAGLHVAGDVAYE